MIRLPKSCSDFPPAQDDDFYFPFGQKPEPPRRYPPDWTVFALIGIALICAIMLGSVFGDGL